MIKFKNYFKLMRISVLFILSVLLISCSATFPEKQMINGVSFVASREAIHEKHITPVVNVNANYAAIMPLGFMGGLNHSNIRFDTDRQWFGETKKGITQYITAMKQKNIKIMLKPQIWIRHGEFTGYIKMTTEAKWKTLESSYSNFILEYAKIAQETNSELLCIGTELERFVVNRPQYWNKLISEIKKVYKGKLTYAANWDEYKRTPFWDKLDYIGIDAYFPVSESQTPTVEDCMLGWNDHKAVIKDLSSKYDKLILFTEFGYRSVDYSAKEPWKSDRSMTAVNLTAQKNATQAIFETFWTEHWFAGGFIWKWHHNYDKAGGANNTMFTPQNKPVEAVIKKHFATTIR